LATIVAVESFVNLFFWELQIVPNILLPINIEKRVYYSNFRFYYLLDGWQGPPTNITRPGFASKSLHSNSPMNIKCNYHQAIFLRIRPYC